MPTSTVVLPQAARGPGTALFGPVTIPSTVVGFVIMFDRALMTDPATAVLAWLDISLDGGATWLGTPLADQNLDVLGIPRQVINQNWATGEKGDPNPPRAFKDNQWPGGLAGQIIPILINCPTCLLASQGSTLRRARGGLIILGTVTTSMTLITYP